MTKSPIFKNAETKFLKLSWRAMGFLWEPKNTASEQMAPAPSTSLALTDCRLPLFWKFSFSLSLIKEYTNQTELVNFDLKSMIEATVQFVYRRYFPLSECLWSYLKHFIKCYLEGLFLLSQLDCKLPGGKNYFWRLLRYFGDQTNSG